MSRASRDFIFGFWVGMIGAVIGIVLAFLFIKVFLVLEEAKSVPGGFRTSTELIVAPLQYSITEDFKVQEGGHADNVQPAGRNQ